MKAATDQTSVQVRRGSSSPLQTAEQANVSLSDFAPPQESDMSADFCGSELHSPMSMNSSASSERLLSPSDSNRNHSDISEGCPSPFQQDKNVVKGQHLVDDASMKDKSQESKKDGKRKREHDDEDHSAKEIEDFENNSDIDPGSEFGEQKNMVDIVGEASSPGEFLNHALEFIKNGKDDSLPRNYWQRNNSGRKSQTPDREDVNVSRASKKTRVDRNDMNSIYQFPDNSFFADDVTPSQKKERSQYHVHHDSEHRGAKYDKRDTGLERHSQNAVTSSLTSNEKFFVEAFKRQVASAVEFAAETSAMRFLEMLEASGVYYGRSPYKPADFHHENYSSSRPTSPYIKHIQNRKRPLSTSSPVLVSPKESDRGHSTVSKSVRHSSSGSPGHKEQIRTSSQSQMCFGSVEVNHENNANSTIDGDTIDLTIVGRGKVFVAEEKEIKMEEKSRNKQTHEEQTQALSLVTKKSPTTSPVSTSAPTTNHQDTKRSSNRPPILDSFNPLMQLPLVHGKNTFFDQATDLSAHVSFQRSHLDYTKLLAGGMSGIPEDRSRRSDKDHRATTQLPFPFGSSNNSLKSRPRTKPRVSPHTDERRVSPRADVKRRFDISTSTPFVEVPSTSAFRPHDTMRSSAATDYHDSSRLFRGTGAPERKLLQPPPPLNLMYPFALPLLPNFPPSPHFAAAALINQARRSGIADYGDLTNGASCLPTEGLPSNQTLRNQMRDSGNYIGGSFGRTSINLRDSSNYDIDRSNFAFPSNTQEGLSPQHLKKAKLIFFYTRYPNANTLKTYFPDVQFTRAITSQLIKWFSNFREFFYIQMEKFARQAVQQGIVDASVLRVSRDSEIFRVLNMHYNKCNEFFVPEKFLVATEASLREFFNAVRTGKDSDPAWKKVIYKVINKLDSEIPELFKSPNVLDRLHEIRD